MERSWAVFALFLALLVASGTQRGSAADRGPCGADLSGLLSECRQYVMTSGPNVPPSSACCTYIRPIDVACACRYVTKDIEKMVSMEKVVYVARSCGKKIPHGTTCGSYKVRRA